MAAVLEEQRWHVYFKRDTKINQRLDFPAGISVRLTWITYL